MEVTGHPTGPGVGTRHDGPDPSVHGLPRAVTGPLVGVTRAVVPPGPPGFHVSQQTIHGGGRGVVVVRVTEVGLCHHGIKTYGFRGSRPWHDLGSLCLSNSGVRTDPLQILGIPLFCPFVG